jgi:hypothetical protein
MSQVGTQLLLESGSFSTTKVWVGNKLCMARIEALQIDNLAQNVVWHGQLPLTRCQQIQLGTGIKVAFSSRFSLQRYSSRNLNQSEVELFRYLVQGDAASDLANRVEEIFSSATTLADSVGFTSVTQQAVVLSLISGMINGELALTGTAVNSLLPFLGARFTAATHLSGAILSRCALLDEVRDKATLEISKIKLTSAVEIEEELDLRYKHYQNALVSREELTRVDPAKVKLLLDSLGTALKDRPISEGLGLEYEYRGGGILGGLVGAKRKLIARIIR